LFDLFNRKKGRPGLCGVSLNGKELGLAFVDPGHGQPVLHICELQEVASPQEAGKVLADKVKALGLENAHCNFVLGPDDYSLLLVEAPAVEKNELAAAAKWKIKDMIDRPIDQVAVSVFPVPHEAYRGQHDMLYVVAADRKKIQQVVDMMLKSGLQLTSIDIPELAMRNLALLYGDDSSGLAMMDLRHNGSMLNLCKDGAIYLSRHLNTQVGDAILDSGEWDNVKDRLVLEIQRSLDYYESQMGQGHITRVLVAPRKHDAAILEEQLNGAMSVKVEMMNLVGKLASEVELPLALQQGCLFAIGGALRTAQAA
jgi:MSHA biogenesis protein MshI